MSPKRKRVSPASVRRAAGTSNQWIGNRGLQTIATSSRQKRGKPDARRDVPWRVFPENRRDVTGQHHDIEWAIPYQPPRSAVRRFRKQKRRAAHRRRPGALVLTRTSMTLCYAREACDHSTSVMVSVAAPVPARRRIRYVPAARPVASNCASYSPAGFTASTSVATRRPITS